jgi:hypothetical protein
MENQQYRQWLREQAKTSDAAFAEYVSNLVFPKHLREMERFLDKSERALVLMPRGHAKTTQLIHRVARLIGVNQGKIRVGILTSVLSDALARSRAIKAIIESPYFAEIFEWARDGVAGPKWTDEVWTIKNTNLGKDATCFADGLGSIKPGARLDILIGDDMVGMKENATAVQRQKASDTYWQVVDPMLVPGAKRWYIGTRWHEDDFYAGLKEKGTPVMLRAAIEGDSPLWPQMYTIADLERKREELGTPIFMLQFQNDVQAMGGNIFRTDNFLRKDVAPDGAHRVGVDLASSASERSDYTSCVEVVEDADHNLYVVGAWRARLAEGHKKWLTGIDKDGSLCEDGGPRLMWPEHMLPSGDKSNPGLRYLESVNIEAVQHQSTFVREILGSTPLPARAVRPDKDKVTRARALAARYEAGKVFHVKGAPGIAQLESELASFPNGEHDDLVDALVYAADLTGSQFYFTAAKTGSRF